MTVTVTADAAAHVVCAPTAYVAAVTEAFSVAGPEPAAAPTPYGRRVQLVVRRRFGAPWQAELHTAEVDPPEWVLNGVGSLRFTMPADDPTLLFCLARYGTVDDDLVVGEPQLIGNEIQLWVDGEAVWWGVPVAAEFDMQAGTVLFDCSDLGWYLSRRFMGTAERRDLLNDTGQMNDPGLPGWTRNGSVVAVRNTTVKARGVGSAMLAGAGYIEATFEHPAHTNTSSIAVYLTMVVRLQDSAVEGTTIATIKAYNGSTEYAPDPDNTTLLVDSSTPLGEWVRLDGYCLVPPGGATVKVQLHNAGSGNRYFDDVRALKNDTTGIPASETEARKDLTRHGVAVINHAQSRAKGSLRLTPVVLAPCGVSEPMGVRHMEHTQITDVLSVYTDRDDGFDWWIDPFNRNIYFAPRRGVDHDGLALHDFAVLGGGFVVDESQMGTDVVVPGDGDAITRPEGGYSDRTGTDGVALDVYYRPPNGTPLSALDPMAHGVWSQLSQPQVTYQPVRIPGDWWPEVQPGDRWTTSFRCGVFVPPAAVADFRTSRIRWDLEADVLELF